MYPIKTFSDFKFKNHLPYIHRKMISIILLMATASKERNIILKDTIKKTRGMGSYKQSELYDPDDVPTHDEITDQGSDLYVDLNEGSIKVRVSVSNNDMLTEALKMKKKGLSPLVLNMTNGLKPGKNVPYEEELFGQTNYSNCANQKAHYPIKKNHFIITENVVVVKDSEGDWLDNQVSFDFIAMPAPEKPVLVPDDSVDSDDDAGMVYRDSENYDDMKLRIDLIFRYAVLEEIDSLLLGPLGYHDHPMHIVKDIFKEAIDLYGGVFKNITFAVPDEDIYEIFKELEES